MNDLVKITLDTNCIINALDNDSETATSVDALQYLISLGERGNVDLAITTRFQSDQANDKNLDRVTEIAAKLSLLPIPTVGSVFRLDVSQLDGGDHLNRNEIVVIENELRSILVPNGIAPQSKTASNNINDIDHLLGHYINNRDIFVTDDKNMLKKSETIRHTFGITVMSPSQLGNFIKKRISDSISMIVNVDDDPNFISKPSSGTVSFDYSNNNHKFTIGDGIYAFDTKWSKAGNVSIHAYNDGPNIDSIAIADDRSSISDVSDARVYDYSSRDRTVEIGKILLMRNKWGAYAAIKILEIQDSTRGHKNDILRFNYVIIEIGSSDFSAT